MQHKAFNRKVITRLSRYRRALLRFRDLGYERITSDILAREVGVTAAQVRKDFSIFHIPGNRRGGYGISVLLDHLENILGKNRTHQIIIVGIGNIGKALMNYKAFEKEGVQIVAGFDINPIKVSDKDKIPILHLDQLESFIQEHHINTAILAVPAISAQEVCDRLQEAGVQGIMNFAPIRLKVKENVVVTYLSIMDKLESIFYFTDGFGQVNDKIY